MTETRDEAVSELTAPGALFKVPTHVLFRDEPRPRTATGTVITRDLRQEFTPNTAS